MLFSHVKISSFRAKAHLVFHCCLYNKPSYSGRTIHSHIQCDDHSGLTKSDRLEMPFNKLEK